MRKTRLRATWGVPPVTHHTVFHRVCLQLYDLKTGQPLKDTAWQVLKQTARFRQEQDGWMHLRTEASNWDRETQQVVAS